MSTRSRSYSELSQIETFEERYAYLRLHSSIGIETFGSDRWINQAFYTSAEWRQIRQQVIVRDWGCDLGVRGWEIFGRIIIHHMNPLTVRDVVHHDETMLDPEFLISVSHRTHNAIHYSDANLLAKPLVLRAPGDTKLWLGENQHGKDSGCRLRQSGSFVRARLARRSDLRRPHSRLS